MEDFLKFLAKVSVSVVCFAAFIQSASSLDDADRPRVFITDSQSWEVRGSGGGSSGAFAGQSSGGARPQTAEIIKTFGQRCPQVITNNREERAEYIVVLDHEGGKSVLSHRNKVAVFAAASGDSISSHSTLSLGASVQNACEDIAKDWTQHGATIRAAEADAAKPKTALASVPATVAAESRMQITSMPDSADIELDGNFVGNTPSTIGVTAGQHQLSVKKSGFKTWEKKITVSSGQVNVNASLEADAK